MLIKDQDQRLKRKILKNISKKKKYKNYNIEYFVNWTFEKLSNSQFEEILDNMTSLLPSEYLTKVILKDVEEISFLEKTLLVYSIIKETIKSIFDSESFSKQSEINHFYLIYIDTARFNSTFDILDELYKKSKKRMNQINAIKTTGKVLGTIAISPLLILGAITKSSINESTSSEKAPEIYYYCKLCGEKSKNASTLVRNFCYKKMRINRFLSIHSSNEYHELYEGGQKSEYICKYCGRKSNTIQNLVINICPVRYRETEQQYKTSSRACISMCEPML